MKLYITLIVCLIICYSFAQTNTTGSSEQYFAQIQVDSSDPIKIDKVVSILRDNPNVFIVRYDKITNGLLFITNNISAFDKNTMKSWFEGNEDIIECYQIGKQNVDKHIAFGTDFCNQVN